MDPLSLHVERLEDLVLRKKLSRSRFQRLDHTVTTEIGTWRVFCFQFSQETSNGRNDGIAATDAPEASAGQVDKPSILLLHGTMSYPLKWIAVVERLTPFFTVYALDVPGFGRSQAPESLGQLTPPEAIGAYCAMLRAWLDACGISIVFLVGHSFGAFLATHFAARHADRVSQLLCMSQAGILPTMTRHAYYWSLLFKFRFPQQLFRSLLLPGVAFMTRLHSWGCVSLETLLWYSVLALPGGEGDRLVSRCLSLSPPWSACWNQPCLGTLLGLRLPVGFLWGSDDALIPADQAELVTRLAGSTVTVTVLEGAGHNPSDVDEGKSLAEKILSMHRSPCRFDKVVACRAQEALARSGLLACAGEHRSSPSTRRTEEVRRRLMASIERVAAGESYLNN